MKNISNFAWAALFILIVPLAIYTAYSGFVVGEIYLPGGFRVIFREGPKVKELEGLSKQELEKRQAELERRQAELERLAREEKKGESQPLSINLSGAWYSQSGLSYQIMQSGNFITFQEYNPLYGVITAVGEGKIQNQSILINYQTASYTRGVSNLTISPDGRSLNGSFQDSSGYTGYTTLNR
jgi:hypothetical protein